MQEFRETIMGMGLSTLPNACFLAFSKKWFPAGSLLSPLGERREPAGNWICWSFSLEFHGLRRKCHGENVVFDIM